MSAAPALQFKTRRSGSPAEVVAGPQAPADRTAAGSCAPAAEPFAPFRAYALAYPARRKGAALHVMTSTLSVRRTGVRATYLDFYRDAATGAKYWAKALADGAGIVRVVVTADPEFALPKGMQR